MSLPGSEGPAAGPGSGRGLRGQKETQCGNSVWAREWAQSPRRDRQGTSDREPENQLGQASGHQINVLFL